MPSVGLLTPFQRDGKGDFAKATADDDALFESALTFVLETRGDSPVAVGEMPWRTSFGSELDRLRFLPNSLATVEIARTMVDKAVREWLPSVEVLNVRGSREGQSLLLEVRWRRRGRQAERTTKVRI